jgi:hypothetical protein
MHVQEDGNDLSQILGDLQNPLHEKSGKAEASLFLSHFMQKSKSQFSQTEENLVADY